MKTSLGIFSLVFFLLGLACRIFPISDRCLNLILAALIVTLLFLMLKTQQQTQKSSGAVSSVREELLIRENSALSVTLKNQSETHQLLCEMRATLSRQRKDAKSSLKILVENYTNFNDNRHKKEESSSSPGTHVTDFNGVIPRLVSRLGSSDSKLPSFNKPAAHVYLMRTQSKSEPSMDAQIRESFRACS